MKKIAGELISIALGLFILFGIPDYLNNHWLVLITWFPGLLAYMRLSELLEEI